MNKVVILVLILFTVIICSVAADSGIPETEETQGITTATAMQVVGMASEEDTIIFDIDDGYYAGGWPHAPPIAPSSVIYSSAYSEDTLADQGIISYTKDTDLDTRGMVSENQHNLKTNRIMGFMGSNTGKLISDETLLLDGAGAGTDTWTSLTCPFATHDRSGIIPPFCNIIEMESDVDISSGMVTTGTEERFIMQVAPDPYYGLDWPWPVSDPGTEMNYAFSLTGLEDYPAAGSASVSMNAHIQEGRNAIQTVLPDETGWEYDYPISSDIVYSEKTTASGLIQLFRKDMNYDSKFTGPAGAWIEIVPVFG